MQPQATSSKLLMIGRLYTGCTDFYLHIGDAQVAARYASTVVEGRINTMMRLGDKYYCNQAKRSIETMGTRHET